ncbi:MAG: single-stranded DNA-binding protein [Micromonosporaceae bacterium]|nr:single-stranded DNA-binding protein [Micromonosporaceae bacterium]
MLFTLTFEGNLAEDPELRFTPTSKAVCRFRVGHSTRRRTPGGEWGNGPTTWITVTAWEALAERVAEHLHRGDTVLVEARDDLSVWAYHNQTTDKPAGQLQVTAANVALSMRFNGAVARRGERAAAAGLPAETVGDGDPWDTAAERVLEAAF